MAAMDDRPIYASEKLIVGAGGLTLLEIADALKPLDEITKKLVVWVIIAIILGRAFEVGLRVIAEAVSKAKAPPA